MRKTVLVCFVITFLAFALVKAESDEAQDKNALVNLEATNRAQPEVEDADEVQDKNRRIRIQGGRFQPRRRLRIAPGRIRIRGGPRSSGRINFSSRIRIRPRSFVGVRPRVRIQSRRKLNELIRLRMKNHLKGHHRIRIGSRIRIRLG